VVEYDLFGNFSNLRLTIEGFHLLAEHFTYYKSNFITDKVLSVTDLVAMNKNILSPYCILPKNLKNPTVKIVFFDLNEHSSTIFFNNMSDWLISLKS